MQRALVSPFVAGQLSEYYSCGHQHAAQTFPHREDFIEDEDEDEEDEEYENEEESEKVSEDDFFDEKEDE